MRKIKNITFGILAVMPFVCYILTVFRTGEMLEMYPVLKTAFGTYGDFFSQIFYDFFNFIHVADSEGIDLITWIVGYEVFLILSYLIFSLFTFLVTWFMDKIDALKGGRKS